MKQSNRSSEVTPRRQALFVVLSATFLGVMLLIAPGFVLFYDITPKIVTLLCGTAVMLLMFPAWLGGLRLLWGQPLGRAFVGLVAAHLLSLLISTALSTQPGLSFAGSNWRRFGLLTHGATMLFVAIFSAYLAANRSRLRPLLRVFATGGLITAIYGILQYFGIDPLVPSDAYHIGEGEWTIVRTPGTLGHAGYFATYLLTAVFWALALSRDENSSAWRTVAIATAALGAFAIVLSGTRGAILGLAAAGAIVLLWQRPRLNRHALAAAFLAAIALGSFYYSPWGEKLRGRTRWYVEDAYGGGRLLLWRDSLRMFAAGPWVSGAGLETYSAEFPAILSPELARAYPNRYYESPHNVFLDALTAQGVLGLLFLAGMTAVAIAAAWRSRKSGSTAGRWFAAAFVAVFCSNQFLALTAPTALCLYLSVALLVIASVPESERPAARTVPRWSWIAISPAAVVLGVFAAQLASADALLASAQRHAGAGEITAAMEAYTRTRQLEPWGMNVDLWFSRWMMEAAQATAAPSARERAWQAATSAGERAAEQAAERQTACYNLALIYGLRNDAQRAEAALRRTIEVAPAWYKPYWMLAQLLRETGRWDEALRHAERAQELNGGENAEVTETRDELRRSKENKGR